MSKKAKKLKKDQKKAAKAKPVKKKVSRIKAKKKIWFRIIAPRVFGNKEIGESYLSSAEKALGRVLKVNLRELTGSVRDQNVRISFQINKLNGTLLNTSVLGYELTPTYVKRLVRKNTSRLDDHFILKTKSGREIIIKSLMITFNRTQRSTQSALRKELHNLLKEEVAKSGFDVLVDNLVHYKVQSILKKRLKKISPLKEVAVRVLELRTKGLAKEEVVVEDKTKVVKKPEAVESTKEEKTPAAIKEEKETSPADVKD
ncbi:MAG: hypothetical protein KKH52_03000 [Nanoarchaeota archaeon]|nr:hypothetical protein [Nanoarchaeota archaeon]MBU1622315.1 hypothetical protein [Nanoarchaeota archaeon]MBU1974337.1 hypothetical protein [Nanoarchaeota archaeon]